MNQYQQKQALEIKKLYLLAIVYMRSYFRLIRTPNLLIIIFAQLCTRLFLIEQKNLSISTILPLLVDSKFILICFSTVIIAGAGYIINDYYDIKIDLINKPNRVIIGKIIPRRWAVIIHQLMNFVGISLGYFVNNKVLAINALVVLLLWSYANYFKRTPFWGNFIVAFITGLSIYILSLYYHTGKKEVIIYAIFSFFITLIREITKDMEDIKGDQLHGCKTLPIVYGIFKSKLIIYGLKVFFLVVIYFLSPKEMAISNYLFLTILLVAILFSSIKLYFADTSKKFRYLSFYFKYLMIVGILSMMIY